MLISLAMTLGMLIYFVLHNVSSRPLKVALVLVFAFIMLLVGYSRVYWVTTAQRGHRKLFYCRRFLLLMTVFYEQIKESRIRRQKVHKA